MKLSCAQRDDRTKGIQLCFAVSEGSIEEVKALLAARANPAFRDYEQRCPLHVAALCPSTESSMIQLLLDESADINAVDARGATPLDEAYVSGNVSVEALLKENGAVCQMTRIETQALEQKWEIRRADVQIRTPIDSTYKSSVYRALWNGTDVVAKFSRSDASDSSPEKLEEEILHEIALVATLRHPDLVMFLGCCIQESPIMFITQYMPGGDLERYCLSKRRNGAHWVGPKRLVLRWGTSILRALNFLHNCSTPIIHRDLKPMNILLTDSLDVKVTDFGISKATNRGKRAKNWRTGMVSSDSSCCGRDMTGGVGTWRYMAPEVARYEEYTEKIDIYSFGLIVFFVCSGRLPFHEYKDPVKVLDEFSKGNEPRPNVRECAAQFRPIMEAAWDAVPEKRPSAEALQQRLIEMDGSGTACVCPSM